MEESATGRHCVRPSLASWTMPGQNLDSRHGVIGQRHAHSWPAAQATIRRGARGDFGGLRCRASVHRLNARPQTCILSLFLCYSSSSLQSAKR
jgi:hypothetical protein